MRSVVTVRALVRDGRYLGLVIKRTPELGVDDFVVSVLQKAEEVGMVKVNWNAPDRPIVEWVPQTEESPAARKRFMRRKKPRLKALA
jgi:hypothetical protein